MLIKRSLIFDLKTTRRQGFSISQHKNNTKTDNFLSGVDACKHEETMVVGVCICAIVCDPTWKLRTDYAF